VAGAAVTISLRSNDIVLLGDDPALAAGRTGG
jgi:hypothetical protein